MRGQSPFLRKFELYQTFYRRLKGPVVPLAVSAEERKRLMLRLSQLIGTTRYECFDAMVELIIAHGHVLEAIRYGDDALVVRYEVSGRVLEERGSESLFQLIVRYSAKSGELKGYTVIFENGHSGRSKWVLCEQSGGSGSRNILSESVDDVVSFLSKMQKDDFAIFSHGHWNMAQVYTDASDPNPHFTVEWQCGTMMWQAATETRSRREMIDFFLTYFKDGLPAAQKCLGPWHLVRWYREWRRKGETVMVGRWLAARLLRAQRCRRELLAKGLFALGVRADIGSIAGGTLIFKLKGGTKSQMRDELYEIGLARRKDVRLKIMAYLSLHGDARAREIVSEHFRMLGRSDIAQVFAFSGKGLK